ncbi:hypothetical protein FB451DRAFT_1246606 [Mycena latifolia]|nr:hypothetical protein FB451DRAFT_1246606 [Mycena latifolia]
MMVNFFTPRLRAIFCLLITHATALPALRATDSVVTLPTPPAGSKVVFVSATDPGIIWSAPWQTVPSACSSGTMRTVSAVGRDVSISYVATYNFRGSGIYVNLQSGNSEFQISIDDHETTFGDAPGVLQPVPANCTYDFSVTDLKDDDHIFKIEALFPSISMDSYWNLGLESLAIIQPDTDSSPPNSPSMSSTTASTTIPSRTSPAVAPPSGTDSSPSSSASTSSTTASSIMPSSPRPPSGTDSNSPSSSGSTAVGSRGQGRISTTDIIAIVTSLIGAVGTVIGACLALRKYKKKREAKRLES